MSVLRINQKIYDALTPEQQAVVDEAGQKAVDYERYINRAGDEEIMDRWQNDNGVTITRYEDMDVDSFKNAVSGVAEWYQKELENQGSQGCSRSDRGIHREVRQQHRCRFL